MQFRSVDGSFVYLDASTHPVYADAHYPRVKQLKDGRYLLIFQREQLGGSIWAAISGDLQRFSAPRAILREHHVRIPGVGTDLRKYMTADAAVLDNGDVLLVCSFRVHERYREQVAQNGLVTIRSVDGGETWTPPQVIYIGSNWEPHILALRSGEIHVYFTSIATKIHMHGFNTLRRSSGTALIRSLDGGETWDPSVTQPPYAAQSIAQQYVTTLEGVKHYTDQMPVATQLMDDSIALALESKAEDLTYHLSMAFSHDNWQASLELDQDGPADRINYMKRGAGPYIVTLDSGRTALSYNTNKKFYVQAGDETAHQFDEPVSFFDEFCNGYWGSLLALPGNRVLAAFPQVTSTHQNGIGLQTLQLS